MKLHVEFMPIKHAIEQCRNIPDNWNGFGAKPPLSEVIESALRFMELLPGDKPIPSEVSPDGEQGITLKWYLLSKYILINFELNQLHISHGGSIKVYENLFIDDVSFNKESKEIPFEILAIIPSINDFMLK